jgi:hypothetical protein
MEFVKLAERLSTSNQREYRDDDFWVDRLCHRYSVVLLTIFAILVTTKAYIGDPIGNLKKKYKTFPYYRFKLFFS